MCVLQELGGAPPEELAGLVPGRGRPGLGHHDRDRCAVRSCNQRAGNQSITASKLGTSSATQQQSQASSKQPEASINTAGLTLRLMY